MDWLAKQIPQAWVPTSRSSQLRIDGPAGLSFQKLKSHGLGARTPRQNTRDAVLARGGETVRLSPGETVVQRGTWHAWRNPDKQKPSRFVMCMIEAK
jgi:hypothetical protein